MFREIGIPPENHLRIFSIAKPHLLRRMFAPNSWSPTKRRAYSPTAHVDEEQYTAYQPSKSPFHRSRYPMSTFNHLSRSLYLRYFFSLLLGLFIGRTIFAPLQYNLPPLSCHHTTNAVSGAGAKRSNSTLGTAAIIALNSAKRPDRRDFLTLMGAMTDIKLTFINTWTTKPVEKALPAEHNPGLKDVEYACWRSHADAWRKVVEEGWETAMIMEDDADWDGGIHESMALAWEALVNITHDPLAMIEAKSYNPMNFGGLILDGIFSIRGHVWIRLRRRILS